MRLSYTRFAPLAGAALALVLALACADDPAGPQDTATDRVVDLEVTYAVAGGPAVLTWTSPALKNGPASSYEIRYSYGPLVWELSVPVDDPPAPEAAGQPQTFSFANPQRGRDLYFAIRVFDADGTPLSPSAAARIRISGYAVLLRCVDVYTGVPAPDLTVTATTTAVTTKTTDANGEVRFDDISAGVAVISIDGANGSATYHRIRDPFVLSGDISRDYAMIPVEASSYAEFNTILRMFMIAGFAGQTTILKKYRALPVPLYAPPLVNVNGIDYQARAYAAAQQWMDRTGVPLYTFVDSPPDSGVVFMFRPRAEMTPLVGATEHLNDALGFPVGEIVRIVDDYSDADVLTPLLLHELGHTIRLQHLPLGALMYGGRPIPGDPTDDEVRIVQLHAGLSNGVDISIYDNP